jgi:hypothetical protein
MSNLVGVSVLEPLGVSIERLSSDVDSVRTVKLGEGANFVAKVTGSGTITLQWNRLVGGTYQSINGAKGEQYRINPVTAVDAGTYTITATNNGTSEEVTSTPLSLEVKKVPVIVVSPFSISRVSSQPAAFRVVVRSESAVKYAWYKDGDTNAIAGASSSLLKFSSAAGRAGLYTVVVTNDDPKSNAYGESVKASARLSVVDSVDNSANAGSPGTAYQSTGWWVYWTRAKDTAVKDPVKDRNGYWLLERKVVTDGATNKKVVIPGAAVWVLGTAKTANTDAAPVIYALDSWNETDPWTTGSLSTQDVSSNEKSDFSVMAYRDDSDAFNMSGRLEVGGDAAVYGAPELMVGEYSFDAIDFDLDLTWDAEQVLLLGGLTKIEDVKEALSTSLTRELANISGE